MPWLRPSDVEVVGSELVDIAVDESMWSPSIVLTGEHNGLTLDSTSYDIVVVARDRIRKVWATHSKQSEVNAFWAWRHEPPRRRGRRHLV